VTGRIYDVIETVCGNIEAVGEIDEIETRIQTLRDSLAEPDVVGSDDVLDDIKSRLEHLGYA